MGIEFFLPVNAAQPGVLRALYDYDRFAAELGTNLDQDIILLEQNLREIAPNGAALLHCLGDLAPLVEVRKKEIFSKTILLGANTIHVSQLLENFSPAGIVELSALNLWRQKRPIDVSYPGVLLRADYFDREKMGTPREDFPYGVVTPDSENLTQVLSKYLKWLARE